MKKYLIYSYTHRLNGKKYIGLTSNIKRRMKAHKRAKGDCPKFHSCIQQDSYNAFEFEVLEENLSKEQAKVRERYYTEIYNTVENGYNCKLGGTITEHSQEYIQKVKDRQKGKGNSFYGKKHTQRHKSYLSNKFSGKDNPNSKIYHYLNSETKEKVTLEGEQEVKDFCAKIGISHVMLFKSKRKGMVYKNIHLLTSERKV